MLTTNVVLKKLSINDCGIGDAGVVAIADALKTNRSLEFIDLSFNPFTRNVITNDIAPMLEINTTLKRLVLGRNMRWINNFVAGALLKTLLDYNDTVELEIREYYDDDGDELQLVLRKIHDISDGNRKGIRIATFKRPAIFFKGLKLIWIPRTHDT